MSYTEDNYHVFNIDISTRFDENSSNITFTIMTSDHKWSRVKLYSIINFKEKVIAECQITYNNKHQMNYQ